MILGTERRSRDREGGEMGVDEGRRYRSGRFFSTHAFFAVRKFADDRCI